MHANKMFYKVVPQRAGGFNVLCGFNTKLVFATAERITSAADTLTSAQAHEIALGHAMDLNAADVADVTNGSVLKKLDKNADMLYAGAVGHGQTFAGMGIAQYM